MWYFNIENSEMFWTKILAFPITHAHPMCSQDNIRYWNNNKFSFMFYKWSRNNIRRGIHIEKYFYSFKKIVFNYLPRLIVLSTL